MMFVRTCARAYVRTSRWKILFTPYLVVELSVKAEIWYMYVTSFNDGTQILTFPGSNNNHDFQNSRFFYGDLIVLNYEWHCFIFPDRLHLLHLFPELRTHSYAKENLSRILAGMSVLEDASALDENVCFTALRNLNNMFLVLIVEMSIP